MTIGAYPAPNVKLQFSDNAGAFLNGGKLFTYSAGTTTKATTYQDAQQSSPNTNPIILDAAGRCSVFLPPGTFFKFTLSPSTDTDPPTNAIWTVDNVGVAAVGIPYAVDSGTANVLAASLVGIPATATAGTSVVIQVATSTTGAATFAATPVGGTTWGAIAIRDVLGVAMVAGALTAGQQVLLTYDGTYWRTQFGVSGTSAPYAVDLGSSGALIAIVAALPIVAFTGANFLCKASHAAAGSDTINVNGWGANTIKKASGASLSAADFASGQVMLLTYDGTNWRTLF